MDPNPCKTLADMTGWEESDMIHILASPGSAAEAIGETGLPERIEFLLNELPNTMSHQEKLVAIIKCIDQTIEASAAALTAANNGDTSPWPPLLTLGGGKSKVHNLSKKRKKNTMKHKRKSYKKHIRKRKTYKKKRSKRKNTRRRNNYL